MNHCDNYITVVCILSMYRRVKVEDKSFTVVFFSINHILISLFIPSFQYSG